MPQALQRCRDDFVAGKCGCPIELHSGRTIDFSIAESGKMCHRWLHMSATKSPLRSNRLVARISQEDKALLEQAASLEGCTVTNFVLSRVREAAAEVVSRHNVVRLNQAESLRFVEALLAKPKAPPERMKRALKLHRDTVKER